MTIETIITDAGRLLADKTRKRWTTTDLVSFLNAALAEIVRFRPEVMQTRATVTLVEGIYQQIPAGASGLISVVRTKPGNRTVRRASFRSIDARVPFWSAGTPSSVIREFAWDERSPRQYLVYPPAESGAQVEIIYTATPPRINVTSENPSSWPAFPLHDRFRAVALNYVLYRAFKVDTGAGSEQKAASYYAEFAQSLGVSKQAEQAHDPDGEPV